MNNTGRAKQVHLIGLKLRQTRLSARQRNFISNFPLTFRYNHLRDRMLRASLTFPIRFSIPYQRINPLPPRQTSRTRNVTFPRIFARFTSAEKKNQRPSLSSFRSPSQFRISRKRNPRWDSERSIKFEWVGWQKKRKRGGGKLPSTLRLKWKVVVE